MTHQNGYKLGVKEILHQRKFIMDLPERVEKYMLIEIFGIITEIIKCKNLSAIFLVEDSTGAVMCDLFLDKVYIGENFRLGKRVIVRGKFNYSAYNERNLIRVESLSVVEDPNRELCLFLEMIKNRMVSEKKKLALGDAILRKNEDRQEQEEPVLYKTDDMRIQILGQIAFGYIQGNYQKEAKVSFYMTDLMQSPSLKPYKKKLGESSLKSSLKECLNRMVESDILFKSETEDVYNVNEKVFEDVEEKVYNRLKEVGKEEFSFEEVDGVIQCLYSGRYLFVKQELVSEIIDNLMMNSALIKGDNNNSYIVCQ